MKDLGVAKHVLGIEIKQECGKFCLNQMQYIKSILKRFNMQECEPISTPMVSYVSGSVYKTRHSSCSEFFEPV
jgi:hypothetical protein